MFMEVTMKILAFNGSPRAKKGATERILQPFLEGAKEAGAEVETIYVAKKKINYCTGCFNCWLVHPGKCIHKDDMLEILRKIGKADMIVYASPIYVDGITAQMKTMMDRCISGSQPFIEVKDGHSRHPHRGEKTHSRQIVFISTCGFGEIDNFEPAIGHMKAAAKNAQAEFIGALVRPMGPVLEYLEILEVDKMKAVYQAFHQGGADAVSKGEISAEVQEAASASIISMEHFQNMANKYFQMEREKNLSKKKGDQTDKN